MLQSDEAIRISATDNGDQPPQPLLHIVQSSMAQGGGIDDAVNQVADQCRIAAPQLDEFRQPSDALAQGAVGTEVVRGDAYLDHYLQPGLRGDSEEFWCVAFEQNQARGVFPA